MNNNSTESLLPISLLEERIDYQFKDKYILETAVTHSSYVKEHSNVKKSNERLEFLGDAFFDAIIGEELFRVFDSKEEGYLSQVRSTLVCEHTLAQVARELEIGKFLKLGNGESKNGGRERKSILADALEAVIGAVYLDGGFDEVKRVVLHIFGEVVKEAKDGKEIVKDHKTTLQEKLQRSGSVNIKYIVIDQSGPDHDKSFTVQLEINGEKTTTGEGKSKKKAEQEAARKMMEKL